MPDIEKIKKDYEKLKSISYSKLIPLNKVIELETEKEIIINKFLSKITRITDDFEIVSTENFTLDDIIELTKKKFGDLNFFDKNKPLVKIGNLFNNSLYCFLPSNKKNW